MAPHLTPAELDAIVQDVAHHRSAAEIHARIAQARGASLFSVRGVFPCLVSFHSAGAHLVAQQRPAQGGGEEREKGGEGSGGRE